MPSNTKAQVSLSQRMMTAVRDARRGHWGWETLEEAVDAVESFADEVDTLEDEKSDLERRLDEVQYELQVRLKAAHDALYGLIDGHLDCIERSSFDGAWTYRPGAYDTEHACRVAELANLFERVTGINVADYKP